MSSCYFSGRLAGEPGLVALSSSACSGKEALVTSGTGFYQPDVLPVTQPTVSKHQPKPVASSFLFAFIHLYHLHLDDQYGQT